MISDLALTTILLVLLSIPLAVTGWAFLDAANRPRWVWAFAGRRQVVWLCVIGFGVVTVIGGLLISGYYLTRVRRELSAIELGDLGPLDDVGDP